MAEPAARAKPALAHQRELAERPRVDGLGLPGDAVVEWAVTHGAATALQEEAACHIGVDWFPVTARGRAHRLQQLAQQPLVTLAKKVPEQPAWQTFALARALRRVAHQRELARVVALKQRRVPSEERLKNVLDGAQHGEQRGVREPARAAPLSLRLGQVDTPHEDLFAALEPHGVAAPELVEGAYFNHEAVELGPRLEADKPHAVALRPTRHGALTRAAQPARVCLPGLKAGNRSEVGEQLVLSEGLVARPHLRLGAVDGKQRLVLRALVRLALDDHRLLAAQHGEQHGLL
eukprot:scaffold11559_cov67-Phaeocystis_antarctica.AAC.7